MYLTTLKDIPSVNKIIQEVKGRVDLNEDYLKFIIKDLVNVIRDQIKKKDIILTKSELKAYLIKSVLKKTKHEFFSNMHLNAATVSHPLLTRIEKY